MALEQMWQGRGRTSNESIESERVKEDNSPLALALKKAEVGFSVLDVRLKMDAIKAHVANAPNINHDNEVEVLHCIGSEALWRRLNNLPDGDLSQLELNIGIPIEDVYSFKRALSVTYQETRSVK